MHPIQPAPIPSIASIPAGRQALGSSDRKVKAGRVMIVDDEPINIKLIRKHLRDEGYQDFVSTSDSRQAVDLVRKEKPDIIILDVVMPHVTGLNILGVIRNDPAFSHLPILIVTASVDEQTKTDALELGATDFLHKPVKPTELLPRVRNSLVLKAHHDQLAAYSRRLEAAVAQRTADLVQYREEVIHVLACAAEYRDQETGNHVLRVGRYCGIIARELGCSEADAELIEQAAILHDAGKLAISDAILRKPGKLTEEEFAMMKQHCLFGERILKAQPSDPGLPVHQNIPKISIRSPILKMAAVIARTHHERWDGTGYPDKLSGNDIPVAGRIAAVADVFDALSSKRCYKDAMPIDKCLRILVEERGKHFDARAVDAFIARIDEVLAVANELAD